MSRQHLTPESTSEILQQRQAEQAQLLDLGDTSWVDEAAGIWSPSPNAPWWEFPLFMGGVFVLVGIVVLIADLLS